MDMPNFENIDIDTLKERFEYLNGQGFKNLNGDDRKEYSRLKKLLEKYDSHEEQSTEEAPKNDTQYDFIAYKKLPKPIKEHLEKSFGNWLNYIPVTMEWKDDYGNYAIKIEVPQQYSTEHKILNSPVYDNKTRKLVKFIDIEQKDIRYCSLKDISKAKIWIDKVKSHIITHAYRKGLHLPKTNTVLDGAKETYDEYRKSLHV